MADYVRGFSERTGKPVVVSSASVNASAAYEISSQADYIYTAKTTAIGAIGTVMQVTDLSGLMEKLGISVDNVTSADSKDSSYGTRPLTEEERAYYQDQVDQINETFIQTVAEGRDMPVEDVRALATGLTFTGMTQSRTALPTRSAPRTTPWRRQPSWRTSRTTPPSRSRIPRAACRACSTSCQRATFPPTISPER